MIYLLFVTAEFIKKKEGIRCKAIKQYRIEIEKKTIRSIINRQINS